jgi:hypothetical protein
VYKRAKSINHSPASQRKYLSFVRRKLKPKG